MSDSPPPPPLEASRRWLLWAWLLATVVAAALAVRNLTLPSPQTYITADEYAYGAVGMEFAASGHYSPRRMLPDGLWRTEYRFCAHPMLLPYLEAASVKLLGNTRLALRLPSFGLLVAGSLLLGAACRRYRLGAVQGLALLATYLLSPWIVFAGTTARPEMLCGFLVLCSAVAALAGKARPRASVLLSGAFAAAAVYNHPIFAGTACLPFLLVCKPEAGGPGSPRLVEKVGLWVGGAVALVAVLAAIFILPHLAAWQEQFFGAARDVGAQKTHGIHAPTLLGRLLDLRARFSTFGLPYLNWYLGVVLLCVFVLRPTRQFWLGAAWLALCTFAIGAITQIYMHYCVHTAFGVVVLVLLCDPPRAALWSSRQAGLFLAALVLVQVPRTAWRVTQANPANLAFRDTEAKIARALASLPPGQRVLGPLEAAMPVLGGGHRFFLDTPIILAGGSAFTQRLTDLSRAQADYEVHADGQLVRLRP